jgi:hypothetical protein
MTAFQRCETLTVIAGAAVRLYRFVQLQADGKYDEVGVANSRADGVAAQAAAADGDAFAMAKMDGGIMKVEAGAAVTRGSAVTSDNQGRAIDLPGGAGQYINGVALDAAAGAGEIIRVQINAAHQD